MTYPDHKWSPTEKRIARAAFDAALEARFGKVIAEFKRRANAVKEPSQMWAIEDFLREQRREIDETFDYRYSQLLYVFGGLIFRGELDEAQLAGLSEDKQQEIRRVLAFARRE